MNIKSHKFIFCLSKQIAISFFRFAIIALVLSLNLSLIAFSQTVSDLNTLAAHEAPGNDKNTAIVDSKEDLLFKAVEAGKLKEVRRLVKEGINVNVQKGVLKMSPLHFAVDIGNVEIVRSLLDAGADVNLFDDNNRTPFLMIDANATPELVNLLLKYGAHVKAKTPDGSTVLHSALRTLPEVLRILINAGADIDAQDYYGRTALMTFAEIGDFDAVKVLLSAGAKLDLKDQNGETALDGALTEEIKLLLKSYGAQETQK